ncbi:unnamed protein product [Rangifer tarandus platyrhynchus]|uniref:Uncharacterized protein n=2 Tax=Rangifer tarandus platyrhynchus TaxID=3082113 RepID=A0ABN8ZZC2_RANTA|nr:unnamed protein product [Rangifer tarandus platyrhynchus]CAI9713656.1 unnamed protein product [Rangifer tarandus platyrhynchus]
MCPQGGSHQCDAQRPGSQVWRQEEPRAKKQGGVVGEALDRESAWLHDLRQATSSSTVQSTAQQAEAQRGSATLQLPFPLSWSRKFRAETSNSNALLPSGGSFCSLRLPRNLILQRNPLAPALRQDPRLPEQAKPLSFSSLTPAFWSTRGPSFGGATLSWRNGPCPGTEAPPSASARSVTYASALTAPRTLGIPEREVR